MKKTEIIMGMPITVEIVENSNNIAIKKVFDYFREVDEQYSPYKKDSELTQINNGLPDNQWSDEMKKVLILCEQTKKRTNGYFDIKLNGKIDPSGLVKGWSINNASNLLISLGIDNFYIEAGGDIQVMGNSSEGSSWSIGIRNPFNINEIIKVLNITNRGIATSGTYIRGQHIYNPNESYKEVSSIKSLTVIGPNIYEADRYATAAFAMGRGGIKFVEELNGFEGYLVDNNQIATYTSGFNNYVA